MARSMERCLGVVVMLGPLAAMLAMIVYGVPQMAPEEDPVQDPAKSSVGQDPTPRASSNRSGRAASHPTAARPSTFPRSARPLTATSRRPRQGQPMMATRTARPTWNHVRTALAAHRVEQFKIQPGSRSGEVHFSCVQPVPGRVRVVRRFEAEAADPVRAARDVLQQIEQLDRRLSQVVLAR